MTAADLAPEQWAGFGTRGWHVHDGRELWCTETDDLVPLPGDVLALLRIRPVGRSQRIRVVMAKVIGRDVAISTIGLVEQEPDGRWCARVRGVSGYEMSWSGEHFREPQQAAGALLVCWLRTEPEVLVTSETLLPAPERA